MRSNQIRRIGVVVALAILSPASMGARRTPGAPAPTIHASPEQINQLVAAAEDPSTPQSRKAIMELARLGEAGQAAIFNLISHAPDDATKMNIAFTVEAQWRRGPTTIFPSNRAAAMNAVPALVAALNRASMVDQGPVVMFLFRIGGEEIQPTLLELGMSPQTQVHYTAVEQLRSVDPRGTWTVKRLAAQLTATAARGGDREAAATLMGELGSVAAPALAEASRSPDPAICAAARHGLIRAGSEAARHWPHTRLPGELLSALLDLVRTGDYVTQKDAANALWTNGPESRAAMINSIFDENHPGLGPGFEYVSQDNGFSHGVSEYVERAGAVPSPALKRAARRILLAVIDHPDTADGDMLDMLWQEHDTELRTAAAMRLEDGYNFTNLGPLTYERLTQTLLAARQHRPLPPTAVERTPDPWPAALPPRAPSSAPDGQAPPTLLARSSWYIFWGVTAATFATMLGVLLTNDPSALTKLESDDDMAGTKPWR
jgi:hypothetical protein